MKIEADLKKIDIIGLVSTLVHFAIYFVICLVNYEIRKDCCCCCNIVSSKWSVGISADY